MKKDSEVEKNEMDQENLISEEENMVPTGEDMKTIDDEIPPMIEPTGGDEAVPIPEDMKKKLLEEIYISDILSALQEGNNYREKFQSFLI